MSLRALSNSARDAVTFIELLIVILIVTSLAVMAIPQFRKAFEGFELNNLTKEICYLSQYLKEDAISRGKIYCLNMDTSKQPAEFYATYQNSEVSQEWARIEGRFGKTYTAPAGITVVSIEPADKKNIYFYPDGSCDTVTVVFQNKAKEQSTLVVKGATGAIQIK